MRVRQHSLVLLAVVGFVVTSVGITPAGAKAPRVTGAVRCTISNGEMSFTPGLRYKNHIEGTQKGRGGAATVFTADLTGCTDPGGGVAPGGIDHGVVSSTGKVRGSLCEKLDGLKLATSVRWEKVDNSVVGTSSVKLGVNLAQPGFDPPWNMRFQGAAKNGSTVFPRDVLSFALDTTTPNWANSGQCGKLSLDSLSFIPGTFAADLPA